MRAEIEKLMRARRLVIESLAKEDHASRSWNDVLNDGRRSLSDAEEQIVATYVLALATNDVADATYQMGPT